MRGIIAKVEKRVAGVISRLPSAPKRLLVALSGGPDSVAALHVLQRIRAGSDFELAAAHFNHGVRGLEADRDERFVRELCHGLDIELVVERAPRLSAANFEEHARELRYAFLNGTADALDAQFIVLGHHGDDQAETVLLRLLRGTGIAGLAGMAEIGPGRLLRPLLSLGRDTIVAYVDTIGATYVLDSSNFETRALRNRVRSFLLPQLANEYSPGIGRRLAELACEMREVNDLIEAEAQRLLETRLRGRETTPSSSRFDVREFDALNGALARAILREFIKRCMGSLRRIERVHIEAMYRLAIGGKQSGTVSLPRGWSFKRDYDTVTLVEPGAYRSMSAIGSGKLTLHPGVNQLFGTASLVLQEITKGESRFPAPPWHPQSRFEAYFDAANTPVLAVRSFRAGDRIYPLGLNGSRKIHDVFIDYKVPVAQRSSWPLVVFDDEVIWIPGMVRSRLSLLSATSEKILYLRADSLPRGLKVRLPEL